VVVIGAGLAGLSTARQLKQQGASVIVLEARERVGGRVHSQCLSRGLVIDLGAQFISDEQRRISALVDEVRLTRVRPLQGGDTLYVPADGTRPLRLSRAGLPPTLPGKLDAFHATLRLAMAIRSRHGKTNRLDALSATDFVRDHTFTQAAESFLIGHLESETCVSGDEISAYEMLDQVASVGGLEGEQRSMQWCLAEGTGPIAQHLADGLGASILTHAPVTRMSGTGDRLTIETPRGSYCAHQVVVAVPPQLYARAGLMPWFSAEHRQVLAAYRTGSVVKTLLVFATPWWRELRLSGTAHGAGGFFNAMVDASPVGAGVGILVLFSTADSGARLGQLRSESDRIGQALTWLRALVGKSVPAPLAARSVDWSSDPWALGGYASRRAPGGWVAAPDLFRSLGRLHFAGTETATEWRSFMEGALQSAERAAGAVLRELAGMTSPAS
jgi:monoamine oxidase